MNSVNSPLFTYNNFINAASDFIKLSDRFSAGWTLEQSPSATHPIYLMKNTYLQSEQNCATLFKAEYVVSFSLSYSVPMFAFNIWKDTGELLRMDEIRDMALLRVDEKEFYSVITQQEHPLFFRPYYVVHPCRTEEMLSKIKNKSKNWLVTFLSLVAPLVRLKLPMEFGLVS